MIQFTSCQTKYLFIMPTTLVLGASTHPRRVSYRAVHQLQDYGEDLILVGIRSGEVAGLPIVTEAEELARLPDVETITLYIGARHQPQWYDFILERHPQRVIFNPGTENPELESRLREAGIEPVRACTLVMLTLNQYAVA